MNDITNLVQKTQNNKLIFMQTDTIPGLVCSALSPNAVEKIFTLKSRDLTKPPTILISNTNQLSQLGINFNQPAYIKAAEKYWPGPFSLIFECDNKSLAYLHRGHKSLAVRLPDGAALCSLVNKTGPLATSSANPQGQSPALTTLDARKYFGDRIDFYQRIKVSQNSQPSTVIRINTDGSETIVR